MHSAPASGGFGQAGYTPCPAELSACCEFAGLCTLVHEADCTSPAATWHGDQRPVLTLSNRLRLINSYRRVRDPPPAGAWKGIPLPITALQAGSASNPR